METVGLVVLGFILFKAGAVASVFYILWRMMRSIGDDSNVTNALRLLNQATIHPADFGHMYYLTHAQMDLLHNNGHEPDQPGWYVNGDEFADVVKTRPTSDHV